MLFELQLGTPNSKPGTREMSEAQEKVLGIDRLPLFPLPLVLMPNELLPLHVFEPRYRQMLKDIELRRNIFGVLLFEENKGIGEKPPAGTIGCAAEVRETNAMPDGRSNILTSGLLRFRLLDYVDTGTPYFTGEIAFFEDEPESAEALAPVAEEVFELFGRVAKAAFKLSGNRGTLPEIPKPEPEPLSFLVSAAFNLDNELKYRFLEMTSTSERLARLREILLQAVDKMEESAEISKVAATNGHSKKKIDL
jgi:Lon protease-like protein